MLGASRDSWQHRITDLVAWADRQGRLSELASGVLYFGSAKRAVREWILATDREDMSDIPPNTNYSSLERRFERLESNMHERLLYVERELQRLAVIVQARATLSPLNWNIIFVSAVVAVAVAVAVLLAGRLQ